VVQNQLEKKKNNLLILKKYKKMTKLTKASPDIEKLVQDISEEVISSHLGAVEFKVFCTKKAKEIIKISKASALHEADIERENVINVVVYEEAFDRADAETQRMWIRMALDPIFYDSEGKRLAQLPESDTLTP
jgi:hypothetical protein